MKNLIALFAICFSLSAIAELQTIDEEFMLHDTAALEYGFPHKIVLEKLEVRPELYGETTARIVGMANEQSFDVVMKLKKIRTFSDGLVGVKAVFWIDTIGGESCDEEITKEISLSFIVAKNTLETTEHSFKASRLHTPDNCHVAPSIREFYYSLMK